MVDVEVDPSLTRPGAGVPDGALAIQQVIYTVQGVGGDRLPVQFVHDGNPVAQVFGLPTNVPLADSPELDVLSLVSISDPAERRVVEGYFSAHGPGQLVRGERAVAAKAADGTVVRSGHRHELRLRGSPLPVGDRARSTSPASTRVTTRSWS